VVSPKLFLDEDVWTGLATALRQVGYDVLSADDVGHKGLSDEEQMGFAIAQDRAILTHNIQDFAPLAATYFEQGIDHPGIIVARHFEKGELLRRTLALLNSLTAEELTNTLRFV
jgi:predicted nuclease of predicted toxin-antitoxin system